MDVTHASQLPLPPPPTIPLLRILRELRTLTSIFEELRDTTGPATLLKLGPQPLVPLAVIITSPDGARAVLGGHDGAFDKLTTADLEMRRGMGDNLFTFVRGPWLPRRRTIQPLFTRRHVASFAGHMADAADGLCQRWDARDGEVDLDREMRRLTLAVLGRTLFGRPLEENSGELALHIERVLRYIAKRYSRPVRAPVWLPTPARRRMRASQAVVDQLSADIIAQRGEGRSDLVDLLAEATDPETGQALSPRAIMDELFVFLAAGHDTTATLLTAALWLLGRHHDIQDAVAEEASAVGTPTVDDVVRLPLTARVLQESLRLYPPAAALIRRATMDTAVCGFRIPAGTDAVVSTWAIHRDPTLWAQPRRFEPDRFLPERAGGRDRWAYLPFGGGERRCVGEHFAFAESVIALATLVRRFHVDAVRDDLPLEVPFTLTAAGPIPARIRVRA